MFVQLLYSLFYDFVSVEAVTKYVKLSLWSRCGPGDLVKTVVECVYSTYFLLDIHVFTKHFGKTSSCHSLSFMRRCDPAAYA